MSWGGRTGKWGKENQTPLRAPLTLPATPVQGALSPLSVSSTGVKTLAVFTKHSGCLINVHARGEQTPITAAHGPFLKVITACVSLPWHGPPRSCTEGSRDAFVERSSRLAFRAVGYQPHPYYISLQTSPTPAMPWAFSLT